MSLRKNDIGTAIILTVLDGGEVKNISSATVKKMYFLKPDQITVLEKTAVFYTDGTDGKLKYTSVDGDFNVVGNWSVQAYLELAGWKGRSDIEDFEVGSIIE